MSTVQSLIFFHLSWSLCVVNTKYVRKGCAFVMESAKVGPREVGLVVLLIHVGIATNSRLTF